MFSIKISILLFILAYAGGTKTRRIKYYSMTPEPPLILYLEYKELKEDMANKTKNPYIIDVREPAQVNSTGMIPTSRNLPLSELNATLHLSLDDFEKKYNFSKPTWGRYLIFYGDNELQSFKACILATRQFNYKRVANYAGGWSDWYNHTMDEQDDRYWENQDT